MKGTDLMPGDLVTFKDCQNDEHPTIVKIWQIDAYGDAFASIDGDEALDEISINDEIVGIPLTPKILEKNGFIPAANGVSWYLGDDDTDECLLMLNEIHNAFVMSTTGMTIGFQYVHQLQHLLRLCGIKKEITL